MVEQGLTDVMHQWASSQLHLSTKFVHAAIDPEPCTGSILTPIFQSSVFVQDSVETYLEKGHSYSGSANPTVAVLEKKISDIEKGMGALCFNSGMSAIVTTLVTFLRHGDHCIIEKGCYGTTQHFAETMGEQYGIVFSFVDFREIAEIEAAIQPNTKLIFSEYPTNPTLHLTDLTAVGILGKERAIKHVCDSTLASPMVIRPLEWGADLVIQSTTKYYDGHNMTIGGAVVCNTIADQQQVFRSRSRLGNIMSPMVAFFTLQSTKTMHLRLREQCRNAQHIAEFLEQHPKVEKVYYPGLSSFPQKLLAEKQHNHGLHGGIVYFVLKDDDLARKKFMKNLRRPWSFGANLGSVESLISCPTVMSNGNMTTSQREAIGIDLGCVRMSCGIEHVEDLIYALQVTLDAV